MTLPVGPAGPYPPVAPPPTEPQPPRSATGAVVPFAAPPTERDSKRLWITLGVGGGLALLCLVGGIIGFAALVVSSQAKPSDATARVTHYLEALRGHDYPAAYDDLCMDRQDKQTEKEFAQAQADQTDISSYQLGTPVQRSNGFSVPADVEAVNGRTTRVTFGLVLDSPGELRICSVTR
jgi:hypothetical protein